MVGQLLFKGLLDPFYFRRDGEGYLLAIVYRTGSHTSHLAVFDAQHVGDGPIGRAHFDHHIPAGFHGTWVPTEREPKFD